MKRFYDAVATRETDQGWQVTLDGRGLKTVKGTPQIAPTQALVEALAREWEAQTEELDPKSFVMRDMADYAIDIVAADRVGTADKLTAYGDTDTLLYRADPNEPLYAKQQEVWEPLVTAFEERERVTFTRISGIIHRAQDTAALETLRVQLRGLDPFTLAGLETMTTLAASLIVGLSAIRDDAEAMTLWRAACLEEEWQADLWGRDHEAEERRAKRRNDFLTACEFTRLARVQP